MQSQRVLSVLLVLCLLVAPFWASAQTDQTSGTKTHPRSSTKKANSGTADQKTSAKIDVNSASKEELDALPGIGDTYAQKIIDGRPYNSKSDVVRKGVLPQATYDKIKDQVTARRSTNEKSDSTTKNSASNAATPTPSRPAQTESQSSSGAQAASTSAQAPPEKGMVWVNTKTGVYHREGDPWYGKTKNGKYMSEADAQKAGYRPSKSGASKKQE